MALFGKYYPQTMWNNMMDEIRMSSISAFLKHRHTHSVVWSIPTFVPASSMLPTELKKICMDLTISSCIRSDSTVMTLVTMIQKVVTNKKCVTNVMKQYKLMEKNDFGSYRYIPGHGATLDAADTMATLHTELMGFLNAYIHRDNTPKRPQNV